MAEPGAELRFGSSSPGGSDDRETRVAELVRILAKVAAGDFSEKPEIIEVDDEVGRFGLAVRFMLDDLEAAHTEGEQRRVELETANARLRELSEMKTRFINAAAHELNTPLTPIRIQLHLLQGGKLGALNDKQRASVEVLGRNLERLSLLVGDVLDAARVQTEHMRITPRVADLAHLVREAVETTRPQAEAVGVALHLDVEGDEPILLDAHRVTQVMVNLLSNALKFTPRGGSVRVALARTRTEARVSVSDTGAGLTQAQRDRLFVPFSQVHDPQRHNTGGTGLGLFISRGILEQHQGRLWCESEGPGRGATFAFALPRLAVAPRGEGADAPPHAERVST
jgi:signal transduction histidine kinase